MVRAQAEVARKAKSSALAPIISLLMQFFLNIFRVNNKLYCTPRKEAKGGPYMSGVVYSAGEVPEDLAEEIAYQNFVARALVDDCNSRDCTQMKFECPCLQHEAICL